MQIFDLRATFLFILVVFNSIALVPWKLGIPYRGNILVILEGLESGAWMNLLSSPLNSFMFKKSHIGEFGLQLN